MDKGIVYINKISAKRIGFDKISILDLCREAPAQLFKVFGLALKVQHGEGDNGPWTKFVGQFEAVSMTTGEIFRSGELFLPNAVTPILEAQILKASAENEKFSGVQFAIEVGAVFSESAATSYEFTSENLLGIDESDPLLQLRQAVVQDKIEPPKKTKAKK